MTFTFMTLFVAHLVFGFILGLRKVFSAGFKREYADKTATMFYEGEGAFIPSIRLVRVATLLAFTLAGSTLIIKVIIDGLREEREKKLHIWSVVDCFGKTVHEGMTFGEAEEMAQVVGSLQYLSGHAVERIDVDKRNHTLTIVTKDGEA